MAVKLDHKPHKAKADADADAEVASCVSNLIQAFTNGLNIFKRLRERRKRRKARKDSQASDPIASAELQLSKSLRKGPEELAERYAECYFSGLGPRFAKGDSIAHASLAETLIKLNTGLVGIITAFLNHDPKSGKSHLDLDYKTLTSLSDASRREALHSMTQLYQRLSHSQLQLQHISLPTCSRCGSAKHVDCSSKNTTSDKEKKKHASSRSQRISGPVVTRMPIRSSSQSRPQLVVMRPKASRKSSSSSNNSSSNSKKSSPISTHTSSLASPLPKYEPIDLQACGFIKGTMGGVPLPGLKQRVDSFDDPRSSTSPLDYKDYASEYLNYPTPRLPSFTPTPRRNPPHEKKVAPEAPLPSPPLPMKRRIDKATPSSYTFASDSTKLGEIPQRNWTRPWDYEEAARLNDKAAVAGPVVPVVEAKTSKKKSLFMKIMRRKGAAEVSARA